MAAFPGTISIAASAQKLDVDNRISLRFYYRIADNLLKQADIYREENNIIDLYIMLLRFSSLITETIPRHRDYQTSLSYEKNSSRKKLLNALTELEKLKPNVQRRIEELNRKSRNQVNKWGQVQQVQQNLYNDFLEWPPPARRLAVTNYENRQATHSTGRDHPYLAQQGYQNKLASSAPSEEQFRRLSLSIPRPKEETLSRHSILGPNGLYGKWQPPLVDLRVQYPSNLDLSPILIPSLQQPIKDESVPVKENASSEIENALESVTSLEEQVLSLHSEEQCSTIKAEAPIKLDIIRQPSPPPVLANVQDLVADVAIQSTQSANLPPREADSLQDELLRAESPLEVHISATLMDSFMRIAKSNTDRSIETCGVLAGSLKSRRFFVTALIIPKQEGTSDSCQTTNEEEIFDYQDKESLFPLGWIHVLVGKAWFKDLKQFSKRDEKVTLKIVYPRPLSRWHDWKARKEKPKGTHSEEKYSFCISKAPPQLEVSCGYSIWVTEVNKLSLPLLQFPIGSKWPEKALSFGTVSGTS